MPGRNIDLMPRQTNKADTMEIQLWVNDFQQKMREKPFYRDVDLENGQQHIYTLDDRLGLVSANENLEYLDEDAMLRDMYQKALNGELFVRAAGEEYPRQITVDDRGMCQVSLDQITGINRPEPPEYPGTWAWLLYNISGGFFYAEEMENYQLQLRQYEQAERFTQEFDKVKDTYHEQFEAEEQVLLDGERQKAEQKAREAEQKKAQKQQLLRDQEEKRLEAEAEALKEGAENSEAGAQKEGRLLDKFGENKNAYLDVCVELRCYDNMKKSTWQLLGVEYPDAQKTFLEQEQDTQLRGTMQFGYYNQAARNGMKATGLSDLHLVCLALSACCTPNASDARRAEVVRGYQHDFRNVQSEAMQMAPNKLMVPLSKGQNRIDFRYLMNEVFLQTDARPSSEFGEMIGAGRQILSKAMTRAFEANPNPGALGALLANGIREFSVMFNSSPTLNHEAMAYGLIAGQLAKICTENREMRQWADVFGLTDNEIRAAAGAGRVAQIRMNGLIAQKKLLEAGAEGKKLENTAALLSDVQLMNIAMTEHSKAYENHKKTPEFQRRQLGVEYQANEAHIWYLPERVRDCNSLRQYGQDTTFPSSYTCKLFADKPGTVKSLRASFKEAPEILEIAQKSPEEVARYVSNAHEKNSEVSQKNKEIVGRWNREEQEWIRQQKFENNKEQKINAVSQENEGKEKPQVKVMGGQ